MLTIRGLTYQYPGADRPALADVSLQVRRQEILGLLGPNGAGKTTLISHLAGITPLQSGSILMEGSTLADIRRRDPTRISLAPQDFAFYPMLSVLENLRCFGGACRLSGSSLGDAIERCLAAAQLERYRDVRADRLSGGLKRRLNLAVALLPSPDLILLDEPTAGVDPQSRAFLLDTVKTLARTGAAIVYTSHYMEEIEAIADQVAILDQGHVLRYGALDDLLREEGGRQLELIVNAADIAAAANHLGRFGAVVWDGAHARLALPAGQKPLEVLNVLESAGVGVEHVAYGRTTLEHLFMNLTHRSLRDG